MSEKHVVAVFLLKDDTILMSQRLKKSHIGQYQLPGGGVEGEEDWQNATIREVLEETGYKCVPIIDLGSLSFEYAYGQHIVHFVVAECLDKIAEPSDEEKNKNTEWEWFNWQKLPHPTMGRVQDGVKLLKNYLERIK